MQHAGGPSFRLYADPDLKLFILVGWDRSFFVCCLAHRGSTDDSICIPIFSGVLKYLTSHGSPAAMQQVVSVESSSLIHHVTFRDLFVLP